VDREGDPVVGRCPPGFRRRRGNLPSHRYGACRAYPPPGKMVQVGDHPMHIDCVGQGSPTVVLDAALGATAASWVRVQHEVSGTTRVCAYDRSGMGCSERGPEPRDAKRVAGELHALLEGEGIEGPCVLVGHSFGGLYTQAYATRYPERVAGVALIESSHPEQFSRLPEARDSYEQTKRLYAVASLLARIGVVRFFNLNPAPPNCRRSSARSSPHSVPRRDR
jgi:pimeloyl-ACP methyl ester carboxylesterase